MIPLQLKAWEVGVKLERNKNAFSSHFQKVVGINNNEVGTNINSQTSPQATHLRFSLSCKMPFTKSKPHRDNLSLVFRNPYNLRDPRSLNQFL